MSGRKEKNDKLSGSICDALLAPEPGDVTFPLAKSVLGPGVVVTDDEVLDAMEVAFREFKIVVEPGGAVALAAALTGKLPVKAATSPSSARAETSITRRSRIASER